MMTEGFYASAGLSSAFFDTEIVVDRNDRSIGEETRLRPYNSMPAVPHGIVIATSTWYPSKDGKMSPAAELRAGLAYRFCKKASELGYKTIVVDGNSDAGWRQQIRSLDNVVLLDQKERGFGPGRREAYVTAANEGRRVIAACEPEKHPLIRHDTDGHSPLAVAAYPVYAGIADGTVPRRIDGLASYPAQQCVEEVAANLTVFNLFKEVVKRHNLAIRVPYLDQQIGPRIFSKDMMPYFLNYPGYIEVTERVKTDAGEKEELKRYAHDMWESHFVPFWEMIRDGKRVHGVPVDYVHPPEQTALESSDVAMDLKRIDQLVAVSKAAERFVKNWEQRLQKRL